MERSDLYNLAGNLPLSLLETVTLNVRQAGDQSTFTGYTVTRVLPKKLDDEQKLNRELLSVTTRVFRIVRQALDNAAAVDSGAISPAPIPKPSDEIVDADGVTWIITDDGVEYVLRNQAFDCICQKAI